MKLSADLVLHGILPLVECLKTLFHAGVPPMHMDGRRQKENRVAMHQPH